MTSDGFLNIFNQDFYCFSSMFMLFQIWTCNGGNSLWICFFMLFSSMILVFPVLFIHLVLLVILQRSYSVSGSCRLGDQLYSHHNYRYWTTSDPFLLTESEPAPPWWVLVVPLFQWSDWTDADIVSGLGGLGLRGGTGVSTPTSQPQPLDSTRECRRRAKKQDLVCGGHFNLNSS